MAQSRNHGAKRQPLPSGGALVPTSRPATVITPGTASRTFSPADFKTNHPTQAVLTSLLAQCGANEAAAAINPWFCDALRSPKSRKDYHDDLRHFFRHLAAVSIHP